MWRFRIFPQRREPQRISLDFSSSTVDQISHLCTCISELVIESHVYNSSCWIRDVASSATSNGPIQNSISVTSTVIPTRQDKISWEDLDDWLIQPSCLLPVNDICRQVAYRTTRCEHMASDDSGASGAKTWLVVGASRGIGREFAEQLLARGDKVIATVRGNTSSFWPEKREQVTVLNCDVAVSKVVNVRAASIA